MGSPSSGFSCSCSETPGRPCPPGLGLLWGRRESQPASKRINTQGAKRPAGNGNPTGGRHRGHLGPARHPRPDAKEAGSPRASAEVAPSARPGSCAAGLGLSARAVLWRAPATGDPLLVQSEPAAPPALLPTPAPRQVGGPAPSPPPAARPGPGKVAPRPPALRAGATTLGKAGARGRASRAGPPRTPRTRLRPAGRTGPGPVPCPARPGRGRHLPSGRKCLVSMSTTNSCPAGGETADGGAAAPGAAGPGPGGGEPAAAAAAAARGGRGAASCCKSRPTM